MVRQVLRAGITLFILLNAVAVSAQTAPAMKAQPAKTQPVPVQATAPAVAVQPVMTSAIQASVPLQLSSAAQPAPPPTSNPNVNLMPVASVVPTLAASSAGSGLSLPDPDSEAAQDLISANTYVPPTYQNLSKLYWTLAMFDLTDNQAIDGFLMINECQLYLKYYESDFELEGLRAATRASIEKRMPNFSRKFEIMIPIGLDRYNIGTEKFSLSLGTQYVHSKRLEIKTDDNTRGEILCGRETEAPKYTRNFILSLTQPFNLTEFYVTPDVAQFFIEQSEKKVKTDYDMQLSSFGRVAFLFMKVTINQFRGFTRGYMGGGIVADMFGTIDSYEVYADQEKTLLLYNAEIAKKNEVKVKINRVPVLPGDGPLIQVKDPGSEQKNNLPSSDIDSEDTRNLFIPGAPKPQTPHLNKPPK